MPSEAFSISKLKQLVAEVLRRFEAVNSNPRCELYYETPYQLLISVVLSAQTTDKRVNACMRDLYEKGFGPKDVIALGEAGLVKYIRSIGLAEAKSRYLYELTGILRGSYGGKIPATRDELMALPGVGRKTANVVCGELYRQATLGVDTHVLRVTQRLHWHRESTPLKAEKALLAIIPKEYLPRAHHWLVLHGRYTCKARKPDCANCILKDLCPYPSSVERGE